MKIKNIYMKVIENEENDKKRDELFKD